MTANKTYVHVCVSVFLYAAIISASVYLSKTRGETYFLDKPLKRPITAPSTFPVH